MSTDLKSAAETMKERGDTAGTSDLYDRTNAAQRFDHVNKSYKKTQ